MNQLADMIRRAAEARERAYAPYSRFQVGACLRGAGGGFYAAGNVENAAYPQGQCAEASAIGMMVAAGERRILEVVVIGGGDGLCTPCGGCRQRLREFAGDDLPIHVCGPEGLRRTTTLGELLPLSFGPETLGRAGDIPSQADAAAVIRARAPGFSPKLAVILGSGLGAVADALAGALVIPYAELPGFPKPGVAGHAGRLVLGRLAGEPILCLQGRVHLYEGAPASGMTEPIRAIRELGVEVLVVTNAAGSLDAALGPGSLMAITDHINLQGESPLHGPTFQDMTQAYDGRLRDRLRRAAVRSGIGVAEGVYVAVRGPQFETPAEIDAFRRLGARAVGMSTANEVILARHLGLRVLGISMITNLAAGLSDAPIDHARVVMQGGEAAAKLANLLGAFLGER